MTLAEYSIRHMRIDEGRETYYRYITADFPPDEVKPWSVIERMLLRKQYVCLGIYRAGNENLCGYAFLAIQERGGRKEYLLDYFAVRKELRGKGIGSWFLAQMPGCLFDAACILLESENPSYARDEDDRRIRSRRLSFYKAGGAEDPGLEVCVYGVEYRVLLFATGGSCPLKEAVAAYEMFYHSFLSDDIYQKQVRIHPLRQCND